MTSEELILTRTLELLAAGDHVSQEKIDEARRLALRFPLEVRQCNNCGRDWIDIKQISCPSCGSIDTFIAVFEDKDDSPTP